MGKAIMFLSGPRAGFDVIDAADIFTPFGLSGHLVEFAILDHHRMYYAKKALVRREKACPSSQGVTLKKALVMLEDLLPVDMGKAYLHGMLAIRCTLVKRCPIKSHWTPYDRLTLTFQ